MSEDRSFDTATITAHAPLPEPSLLRPGRGAPDKDRVPAPVDSQVIADAQGTRLAEQGHPAFPAPGMRPIHHFIRWTVITLLVGLLIAAAIHWGSPIIEDALNTVSTDDAFVSGHLTNVAPRVEDMVTEVLIDQNDRVFKGQLLVRLDRQPYEVALGQAMATLGQEKANLAKTRATVKSQIAALRSTYFRLRSARDNLRSQVATLRSNVAELRARQSSEYLAEVDFRRIANLVEKGSATQSELDTRRNTLDTAREQSKSAWARITQTRASLGLAPDTDDPAKVPEDLEQVEPTILTSQSDVATGLARLGVDFDSSKIRPDTTIQEILNLKTDNDLDKAFNHLVERVPDTLVAIAQVEEAEQRLNDAQLRLSWTEIRSEIDGYIQDRYVNPGNRVQPGQTLVSIRPTYVWISANYKETQIHDITIGMPVDIYVDAYPGKIFEGRVAGFSPGTGLSQSLLPPENATGNYVKVTQRLPVRIELIEPNPDATPLFAGLSVVPHVRVKEKPTGPGAGGRLHTYGRLRPSDSGGGPAGVIPENRDPAEATPTP